MVSRPEWLCPDCGISSGRQAFPVYVRQADLLPEDKRITPLVRASEALCRGNHAQALQMFFVKVIGFLTELAGHFRLSVFFDHGIQLG